MTVAFAIRFVVLVAAGIAIAVGRGFQSFGETFALVLAAALIAQGLALAVRDRPRAAIGALIAVIALGGGADAYLVATRVELPSPTKYLDAAAVSEGDAGRVVKLRGTVTAIVRRADHDVIVTTFMLDQVHVTAHGVLPDAFRDRASVVATGRLTHTDAGYALDATEVNAKCPDRYSEAPRPAPP